MLRQGALASMMICGSLLQAQYLKRLQEHEADRFYLFRCLENKKFYFHGCNALPISKAKGNFIHATNRPWRHIGLRNIEDPTFSKQSAHHWW
jgi:hypothetical protein